MNHVEIGLLTCTPHDEVYSLYGHAALCVHDTRTGSDDVYTYGIFNYKAPHFVWRFIMGQTDYELGVTELKFFVLEYKKWGSEVSEQILNLTPQEKLDIIQALKINALPQNKVYRYNFFYDNCATRPRDIVERSIHGKIIFNERGDYHPSYREMIHELTREHPWSTFGNDLLLGMKADAKTTRREQEFLPKNLQYDFAHAVVERDGIQRPLVKERRIIIPAGEQIIKRSFPLSPLACALILLSVSLFLFYIEQKKRKTLVWWDAFLMLVTGLAGIIIVLMFFSEHPATSTNLQVLILNPLPLFFIPQVLRRRKTRWFKISMIMTLLFLAGAFLQDYAEGLEIVALCLLTRYVRHRNDK